MLEDNYYFNSVSTENFNAFCQILFDSGYTTVFVRGGFKHWIPFLQDVEKKNGWLLFYGANTGNERWPFWDVVFDDIDPTFKTDNNERLYYPYIKPINENVFRFQEEEPIIDVCIGASNIHDKKGQWLGYKIIKQIEEKENKSINWIMPGALRRGVKTNEMINSMSKEELSYLIGPVDREHLSYILNKSKIFIHFGTGGQGDRGPIEALACGCQTIVIDSPRHSPDTKELCLCCDNQEEVLYDKLSHALNNHIEPFKRIISNKFKEKIGIEKVIANLLPIFNFLKKYPKKNREKLIKESWI